MPFEEDDLRRDVGRIDAIREVPLILEVCRKATGMGFVAVARVTEGRWITCASLDDLAFGLRPGDELEVESTLCQEVRATREVIVIEDVGTSPTYGHHPTPRRYGFRSYVSVPIVRADGRFFGTICAIHPTPTRLSPETVAMFRLFAQLIATELDGQEELESSRGALATERDTARVREEFIAVVGHDLRNPVAALAAGLGMLAQQPTAARAALLIPEMQRSVLRMQRIIDNLLDLARGRLGPGIELDAPEAVPLAPVLHHVVQEVRQVSDRPIAAAIDLPRPIRCDPQRLAQLLSNLVGNAVAHGAAGTPIRVEAADRGDSLWLAVTNQGPAIPDEVRPSLFRPFSRGGTQAGSQGLGLGLYIASEIAKAHGGRLDVTSDEAATTFALTMPLADG